MGDGVIVGSRTEISAGFSVTALERNLRQLSDIERRQFNKRQRAAAQH
jgi:hypothetical protein